VDVKSLYKTNTLIKVKVPLFTVCQHWFELHVLHWRYMSTLLSTQLMEMSGDICAPPTFRNSTCGTNGIAECGRWGLFGYFVEEIDLLQSFSP